MVLPTGDNFSYYQIVQQRSFTLDVYYRLRWNVSDGNGFTSANDNSSFTAPICWLGVRTADLFSMDSTQIVANAVGNVNNSVNKLNDKLTEDNSNQDNINLGTHNDEMNDASDTIKNSNLYSKFDKILNDLDYSFTYNDDEVETIPIRFYGKSYVLRSDEISSFFKNNGLAFVVTLWQSILWFSLLYTMFVFIRKLYKAFIGGNPVDEVSSTLSSEDNKIIGGF